jgi:hypothetical protein
VSCPRTAIYLALVTAYGTKPFAKEEARRNVDRMVEIYVIAMAEYEGAEMN